MSVMSKQAVENTSGITKSWQNTFLTFWVSFPARASGVQGKLRKARLFPGRSVCLAQTLTAVSDPGEFLHFLLLSDKENQRSFSSYLCHSQRTCLGVYMVLHMMNMFTPRKVQS